MRTTRFGLSSSLARIAVSVMLGCASVPAAAQAGASREASVPYPAAHPAIPHYRQSPSMVSDLAHAGFVPPAVYLYVFEPKTWRYGANRDYEVLVEGNWTPLAVFLLPGSRLNGHKIEQGALQIAYEPRSSR